MASNAISAQGSTLHIATGTGGAKTITAAAIGNPTILTSAAHGLAVGDVVTIASISGTLGTDATNGLNGKSFVITHKTTNTIAVDVDSTGLVYTSGGTATPVTWTQVMEIKSFSGFDGSASEVDITNLDSTAKEFRLGLQDFGSFKVELNVVHADAGQAACAAAMAAGTVKNFKVTLPNAEVGTFSGLVKSMPAQGGVDATFTGSMDIRITGSVTWA